VGARAPGDDGKGAAPGDGRCVVLWLNRRSIIKKNSLNPLAQWMTHATDRIVAGIIGGNYGRTAAAP